MDFNKNLIPGSKEEKEYLKYLMKKYSAKKV
jgi:hypothetical protein